MIQIHCGGSFGIVKRDWNVKSENFWYENGENRISDLK